jgi:hypothetical protein
VAVRAIWQKLSFYIRKTTALSLEASYQAECESVGWQAAALVSSPFTSIAGTAKPENRKEKEIVKTITR